VLYTVTDIQGNVSTCTFTVTVIDDETPELTCPANITVSNDANACNAAITVPAPAVSDECGLASIVNDYNGTANASGTYPVGITTVLYTVTDVHGNVSTCSFTVTVVDDELPQMTCPIDQTVNADANCQFLMVDYIALGTYTDNCDTSLDLTQSPAPGTLVAGTTVVTITATDDAGNENTCTFNVIVEDTTDPIITTCAPNVTEQLDANCELQLPDYTSLIVADDNCDNDLTITQSPTPGTVVSVHGTVVPITITVTDDSGNNTSCSFQVTLEDSIAPSIVCSSNVTVSNDANVCEALVTIPVPVTDDNCQVVSVVNDYTGTNNASGVYPVGTTTVEYTVTDINNNVTTCTFTVTVIDDEAPELTCPANITVSNDANACNAAVTVPAPNVSDECGIASIVNDYNGTANASGTYPVGTTTVEYTVTDVHGNVSTCTFTVIVIDDEAPEITCPANITITNDANACDAALIVPALVADDECGIATIVNNYNGTANASDTYPVGITTVEYTVTDIHGNVSTCTFTVTVIDDEAPEIICPTNITISNDANACDAFVIVPAINAVDECGIASIVNDYTNIADASGTYPVGTTTVEYTVTDIHGNVSTCTFTVTVIDDEAPEAICPSDITVSNDANECEAMVAVPPIVVSEECGIQSITNDYTGTDNASGIYPVGTTQVEYTVTDIYGNISTCTINVIVLDDEAPEITCPSDITINNDVNECAAFVDVSPLAAADECGVATITNNYNGSANASDTYHVGTTVVVYTVTDIHGNVSTCSFNITVVDNEAPSFECQEEITINSELGLCNASVTVNEPIVTDNCAVASVVNDYNGTSNATDIYPVGTTIVTWTITDIHGNTSSCITIVNVVDNELPNLVCPPTITVNNDPAACGAQVTIDVPNTSDNCGVLSVVNSINGTDDASGFYPIGTTNVTWTVTDINNNVTTCITTVEVVDAEIPTIICPLDIITNNDPGNCSAVVLYNAPVFADNCTNSSVAIVEGLTSGSAFPVGVTTVTYEVTDASGNTATCSFTVTVNDNEVPTITCPPDIEVNNDPGLCGAIVTYPLPTTDDNCGIASLEIINGFESGTIFEVGVTIVSYRVTDLSGNSSICSFEVTVNDTEAPMSISCPENIYQEDPIVEYTLPVFNDNCAFTLVLAEGEESGSVFPHGITTVIYQAIDAAGNTTNCVFTVTINLPPDAEDDNAEFDEDDSEIVIDVIDNDTDPDGDPLTVTNVTSGSGQASIDQDGNISYVNNPEDFCGMDTLTYVVCDNFGACDTAQIFINVECPIGLIIPEAFSPNGDGVNDNLVILGLDDYPNNSLSIFNRYGHKVFEANNYQNDWDGTSESGLTIGSGVLPKGTYFYILDLGNGEKIIKGFFYLNK
jgi:gliding motility-associated-like protein